MVGAGDTRLTLLTLQGEAMDRIGEATALTVEIKGLPPVTVAPTGTGAALRSLAQCGQDVGLRWGVPAAEATAVATAPAVDERASNLGVNNYPVKAIQAGAQGTSTALLMLDEKGRVRDCVVKAPSGNRDLDVATCAMAKGARYSPALDRQGQPMAAHVGLRVTWSLPQLSRSR